MSDPKSPVRFWNNRSIRFVKRTTERPQASLLDRAFVQALRDPRPGPFLERVKAAIQVLQEAEARGTRG